MSKNWGFPFFSLLIMLYVFFYNFSFSNLDKLGLIGSEPQPQYPPQYYMPPPQQPPPQAAATGGGTSSLVADDKQQQHAGGV